MRLLFFDTHPFERETFQEVNKDFNHELVFLEPRLNEESLRLAEGAPALCCFVNDRLTAENLAHLKARGTSLILLRSAGFNHVNRDAAKKLGLLITRVPEYSPYSVAEYAVALILCLNRKLHRAFNRVREGNFLLEGLVGFDLHGKTVGVVGTGKIGRVFSRIMQGFGTRLIAYDLDPKREWATEMGLHYVDLETLCQESDIISLHIPLTPQSKHMLNARTLAMMKEGVMIINTGRGALIETQALVASLKRGHVGYAGLDVYEEEEGLFFEDHSGQIVQDDLLARLMTFPNVLLTSHQAFLTREALVGIATTTLESLSAFEKGLELTHKI